MKERAEMLLDRLDSLERMREVARESQDYELEKRLGGFIHSVRQELYDIDPLGALLTHFIPAAAR